MNVQAKLCTTPEREEPEARFRVLMIRALDGDSGAYRELLGELSRYLRGYFKRRIRDPEAEDLVQETLLAVHSKRHTYDRALPFTPWAYAVARYKLADHFRRNHSPHVPLDEVGELQLLAHLPTRQRSLIKDVKLQGLSVAGCNVSAAADVMTSGRVDSTERVEGVGAGAAERIHAGLRTERCASESKGVSDGPSAKW
jgi:RNA polymerase sigma-70 factor, ECF subfamily